MKFAATSGSLISIENNKYVIRTTELLKEGRKTDIPFTTKELRESECQYAFRVRFSFHGRSCKLHVQVKWVGYEGEDTWQSYESLNDEKRRAKDYARLHSLDLFPNKKQVRFSIFVNLKF